MRCRTLIVIAVGSGVLLSTVAALANSDRPILFHVFGQGDYACGDYYEKVTGIVVWNQFRNRSPERAAKAFLVDLRANQCSQDRRVCEQALLSHRASEWRLENRQDLPASVVLYFRLTKYGTSDPGYHLSGEGMIQMQRRGSGWTVANYNAYF